MIVGQKILDAGLVTGGTAANLKHGTFDLTVGEIIPIGKAAFKSRRMAAPQTYFLEPREMVWILSKEEFNMSSTVTGLATLKTAFTKVGILALNVGIIDSLFKGPISTALINFSDRTRRIDVGEKFFRVMFIEHDDVSMYHGSNENIVRKEYIKQLETMSYNEFSRTFLNIPDFDDNFYKEKFLSTIYYGFKQYKVSIPLITCFIIVFFFLFHLGLWQYMLECFDWIKSLKDKLPF